MQAIGFLGAHKLIALIDDAIRQPDTTAVTTAVCDGLGRLFDSGQLVLPSTAFLPLGGRYARRLLYRSEEHGYVVTAMTWGPGQSSPIHDHAGAWGVESVVSGCLKETRYQVLGNVSGYWRLKQGATERNAAGSSGSLIPQQDYHRVANPSHHVTAVTLNIYSRDLTHCRIFARQSADLYTWRLGRLAYDPWDAIPKPPSVHHASPVRVMNAI